MFDNCPECMTDLRAGKIPQDYIDAGYYGTKTHYSRLIGYEEPGLYDGVLVWLCPDCGYSWPRFDKPSDLHYAGIKIIESWEDQMGHYYEEAMDRD